MFLVFFSACTHNPCYIITKSYKYPHISPPLTEPHCTPLLTQLLFQKNNKIYVLFLTSKDAVTPMWSGPARGCRERFLHYIDVIMTTMASEITSLTVVYSTVYSDADQRKHQSSASLAFVWGIHRDRWIPRTEGQLRGKCFHLMTSSCVRVKCLHWRGSMRVFNMLMPHFTALGHWSINTDQSALPIPEGPAKESLHGRSLRAPMVGQLWSHGGPAAM